MKWEPRENPTVWCDCQLEWIDGRLHLNRKGVVRDLQSRDLKAPCEWDRWIPACAANAKAVMRAVFPSITLRCLWYALNIEDVITNFRSMFWGIGFVGYTACLWKPAMRRFISDHALAQYIPIQLCESWVRAGRLSGHRGHNPDFSISLPSPPPPSPPPPPSDATPQPPTSPIPSQSAPLPSG